MFTNEKLTKSSIKRLVDKHPDFSDVLTIRDTDNRAIQLRFLKCGTKASWRLHYKNKWLKVGEYPELNIDDIRAQFSTLMADLRKGRDVNAVVNEFVFCRDLFIWALERLERNAQIGQQTKKDVKSALHCHLLPLLGEVRVDGLSKDLLSDLFIWPLQEDHKFNTVHKVFHIAKRVFRDAVDLDRLKVNPLGNIKFNDFNLTKGSQRDSHLTPHQVANLLDELSDKQPVLIVLVLMMLTLGTRVGETLKAKWRNFGFVDPVVWDIPASDTKTGVSHSIALPKVFSNFLASWRVYLSSCHYSGPYVFPNSSLDGPLQYNDAAKLIKELSSGVWSSHDLRRCARKCWALQSVDFMVGERMLNHSLGKVAEAYLDKGNQAARLKALEGHCNWLLEQNAYCFYLNPNSTPSSNDDSFNDNENGAYV